MAEISTAPRLLRRIDPARNMARFYVIAVLPTLFGTPSVVRRCGRIGSRGRERIDLFERSEDANRAFDRLLQAKRRRGYVDR
ncbi:MAG: WGR domain-containing protein [Pseudomonadota bacterium]